MVRVDQAVSGHMMPAIPPCPGHEAAGQSPSNPVRDRTAARLFGDAGAEGRDGQLDAVGRGELVEQA
jgi:hypothetical protein